MNYDKKVRLAEISVVIIIVSFIAFVFFSGVNRHNQQGKIENTNSKTSSYEKHKKFLTENDCWVILVVKRYDYNSMYHYQCLKGPEFYTYRSIHYYPNRDYYNRIEGMTEVERLQKQIAVNKQIKPNYFENAY